MNTLNTIDSSIHTVINSDKAKASTFTSRVANIGCKWIFISDIIDATINSQVTSDDRTNTVALVSKVGNFIMPPKQNFILKQLFKE